MAKTSSINRNEKRRKMSKTMGNKRAKLKAIVMKKDAPMEERFAAALKLAEMPRNSAKVRIRNRCELTGRPRAFYRKVKLSRIALREMANKGLIPGMVKSSW
ncbi:MAG: 30S ribosomal protein S14 [Alphaproteobacteria bacterium]|nr:30S ribosomal protein S14 [Alphaproteobacteria bacterium]